MSEEQEKLPPVSVYDDDDDDDDDGELFKIILIGDGLVGKTCMLVRYVHNIFVKSTKTTIGVDFGLKTVNLSAFDDKKITVQFWDIAGQERFAAQTKSFYRGSHAAIIVFDLTQKKTFESAVNYWKADLDDKCQPNIPCILVGNKNDLKQDSPFKSDEEVAAFCEKHGFSAYHSVSAKTKDGIDKCMEFIATEAYRYHNPDEDLPPNTISLTKPNDTKPNNDKKPCCGTS